MDTIIGILGYDFVLSTSIVDKIITNTKANTDQEHIKMNIVINNMLKEKTNLEIIDIIKKLENSNINYLVITFNDERIINIIKKNTTIPVIEYSNYQEIIKLAGKEVKE